MCAYGCGYADAIRPLRMGHIKCGTGHIIIGIHKKLQLPMWDWGFNPQTKFRVVSKIGTL